MRPKNTVVVAKDWLILKANSVDTGKTGKSCRAEVFIKWPNVTLCRPGPSYKGVIKAYRVVCDKNGCKNTKLVSKLKKQGHPFCWQHAGLTFQGLPVRAPHVILQFQALVKAIRKPTGGYRFYIQCRAKKCPGLVEITQRNKKGRSLCRGCSYDKKRLEAANKAVVAHAGLPGIVAYRIYKRQFGYQRTPMCKCASPNCENLITWPTRYGEDWAKKRQCKSCHGNKRRKRPFESAWNVAKKEAARRSIEFIFPYEQYALMMKKPICHYCAVPLPVADFSSQKRLPKNHQTFFIDRKNNNKGYSAKNCVLACVACNLTKFRLVSYEEMLILGALRGGNAKLAFDMLNRHAVLVRKHGDMLQTSNSVVLNKKPDRLACPAPDVLDFHVNTAGVRSDSD